MYGYEGMRNLANNLFYLASGEVVYYTAALGVVFSKQRWRDGRACQRFFFGHDNDVACLAVHPNRRFVATGQQVRFRRRCHFEYHLEYHFGYLFEISLK